MSELNQLSRSYGAVSAGPAVIELDRRAVLAAADRTSAGVRPTDARRTLLFAVDVAAAVAAVGIAGGTAHDTSIEERVRFDDFYIEHWSLWGDVKILTRTVASVIRLQGG
jgi:hypothetical protein